MSKLKCEERSCKHNCYLTCDKQSIILDDDAICCSYQRQVLDEIKTEFSNEKYPEYNDVETTINCNEDTCYFNKDRLCKASEVKIDSDAWCSTYRRR
jgi:hypothetical protein